MMLIGGVAGVLIAMAIDKQDPVLTSLMTVTGTLPGLAYAGNEPVYGFLSLLTLLAAIVWRVKKRKKKMEKRNL